MTVCVDENLYNKYYNQFSELIKTDKSIIYHYTSSQALLNILKNGVLWFSDANFLNDKLERKYIYNLIYKYVNDNASNYNICFVKEIKAFCRRMSSNLPLFSNASNLYELNNFYVASFSLNEDNLPLWNYYTKNKDGIGFDIAFDKNIFFPETQKKEIFVLCGKVIYSKEEQINILSSMINDFFEKYKNISGDGKKTYRLFLLSDFIQIIHSFSLFFKHFAFQSEEEFRFVFQTNNNISYREKDGFFIPFVEQTFNKNCVKNIIISPTQKQDITEFTLQKMLASYNYKKCSVKASNISIRY